MVLNAVEVGKSGAKKKVRFDEGMDVDGCAEELGPWDGDPRVGGGRTWDGQVTPASVAESGNGSRRNEGDEGETAVFKRRVLA